jgi:3-oxoacyl-[acyl-carrier-protein] synthase-3
MHTLIKHFRISGLGVTTGSTRRNFIADGQAQGVPLPQLERVAKTIGLRDRMVAPPDVTSLDLCEDAAQRLISEMGLDVSSIDAVIFVTQTPDHSQPNNASLLHGRLGLSKSAFAFDLALGCSGWVAGLHQAALLCAHGGAGRVLLCAGDTLSRLTNPKDRAADPLFGDAGSATIVERTGQPTAMHFVLGADGKSAQSIIVPAGGARQPTSEFTHIEKADGSGNLHHAENLHMDGAEVFNFSLREIPPAILSVMQHAGYAASSTDALILHQANKFIVDSVAQKVGFTKVQAPSGIVEKFGNQSSASIPCALIDALGETLAEKSLKLVGCGFGVGLSWAAFAGEVGPLTVVPILPYPRSV